MVLVYIADFVFCHQEFLLVEPIDLCAMALSMLSALFGIAVATSSKRNAQQEEAVAPTAGDAAKGPRRKPSMADKYLSGGRRATQTGFIRFFTCDLRAISKHAIHLFFRPLLHCVG